MKKNIFILFIISISLFSACKSKQSVSGSGEKATSVRHLVKLIEQAQPNFTTMNANSISLSVNMNGTNRNVSASMKMKTDSVVVLSIVPFMGIEMFSVELYPEKWIIYDKINRNYYTDNYEYLYYKFGIDVDFKAFQSLLSARLFSIGQKEVDAKKLNFIPLESDKNSLLFESRSVKQSTTTNNKHIIEQVSMNDGGKAHTLLTTYSDYSETRGVNFPRNIAFELFSGKDLEMSLSMKIQKVTFNSDLKLSVSNPERYTRSTLDKLIK